jgi:hypothetical protein
VGKKARFSRSEQTVAIRYATNLRGLNMNRVGTYFGIANFVLLLMVLVTGCKTNVPNSNSGLESYQRVFITGDISNDLNDSLQEAEDLILSVDWEHRQSEIDIHRINLEITHEADSVSYVIHACDKDWEDEIRCSDTAYFTITAYKNGLTQTYSDSINLQLMNQLFVLDRSIE